MPESSPHAIPPFRFEGDADIAWQRLIDSLESIPRLRIIEQSSGHLRAECRSAVFRFVDVLEFQLVRDGSLIHVRSESQTGYSDFGVNRRRIERLRAIWRS